MIGKISFTLYFTLCAYVLLIINSGHQSAANNLELLSGTLKTFERKACDDQIVTLRCPIGTCISVELAHYGNIAGPLDKSPCKPRSDYIITQNNYCMWPKALQYSLLQTVVETCQKKQQCKFHTSPKTFGGDPCPGVQKYVEVEYKCAPDEFRSKVACQNDVLHLTCNPPKRIAIYSASFGRTEYESVRCPQPQGVREETCLVSYATETVIQKCHGKSHCTLSANTDTFGNPCHKDSRMYLKVVFTCVPRKVLRSPYGDITEDDLNNNGEIIQELDYDIEYNAIGDPVIYRERNFDNSFSPSPKLSSPNISGNTSQLQPPPRISSNTTLGGLRALVRYSIDKKRKNNNQVPTSNSNNLKQNRITTNHRVPKDMRVIDTDNENNLSLSSAEEIKSQAIIRSESNQLQPINCTVTIYSTSQTRVIGFISEWINTYKFLSQNREKLILYLILSVGGGILTILILVIGRLLWQRRRSRRHDKYHASATTTTLPNGFNDDISEIDADIGLTTVNTPPVTILPPSHHRSHSPSEVVRYSGIAGDSNAPRSLSRSGNSQYYYG